MRSMKRGITLVEVLIAIAIAAIIAAVTYPVFVEVRSSSKRTKSISNLRQLHSFLSMYRQDYGDEALYGDSYAMGLPPDLGHLVKTYKIPKDTYTSPGPDFLGKFPEGRYVGHYGPRRDGFEDWEKYVQKWQDQAVILSDQNFDFANRSRTNPFVRHRGIGLYLGGHVRTIVRRGSPTFKEWWNP